MEEPQSKVNTFFSQENFEKFKTRCATIIKRLFSCCMSLETFTFAFSIFNIVVVTVASIISMVTLVYFGTNAERIMSHIQNAQNLSETRHYYYWENREYIMYALISWILVALSLISVVFAVVLIQGVIKKKPGLLKAYLIYGVVVNLVVFLASIILWLSTGGYYRSYDPIYILFNTGFIFWFMYTCVLITIQLAYQKFRNDLVDQEKSIMDTKAQLAPFSCFSLESGTLVFAVFNMVVTSLVSIASAVGFLYWIIGMIEDRSDSMYNQFSEIPEFTVYAHCIIYLVLLTFALISSAFAGLLLYGVLKRNPELLKVYFIYGVVVDVLSVLGAIVFLQVSYFTETIVIAVASFIICFLYPGILFNIYKTYRKFENIYYYHCQHQQLVESKEHS